MHPTARHLIGLLVLAGAANLAGQQARFFRILGPTATMIIAYQSDGTLTWKGARTGATYTIQTATSLVAETKWVDYVQVPGSTGVTTHQLPSLAPPVGMSFIPAGYFMMGDTLDGQPDAIPTNVYVSAFYMDTNLISYSQWQSIYNYATNHGYRFDNSGNAKATNHPVYAVNWYDVVKWSNARSQQAGLPPVYYTDAALTQVYKNGDVDSVYPNWTVNGYRLPTEAEWEKAARGGLSNRRFPWGDTISETQANYNGDTSDYSYDLGPDGYNSLFTIGVYSYTSPVGYFAPNGYGLYDMAGNLAEWCWDWSGTPYAQPTATNPTGPTSGIYRILRGGDWFVTAYWARCACHRGGVPSGDDIGLGFRCVRGL